jgi:NAD(P)-dependent dehydrogenase (short-subunit alcohol dehydrogenase family)
MKLNGKVAIITGAALGFKEGGPSIGSAIALRFASEGAKIVAIDINEEMGNKTVAKILDQGGEGIYIKADVSDTEQVKDALKVTEKNFKSLDILVNCAASYEGDIFKNVVDIPESDWQNILNINLNGYFRFAKYSIPLMLKSGGGTIVNISSCAAFQVNKNFCVYPVSKAAINALTRSIAMDFAPQIRCNAICPGFVRIANSENNRTPEEIKRWISGIAKQYPMRRVCTVEEIANTTLFLACKDSSYVNGQCLIVDGGKIISEVHEF